MEDGLLCIAIYMQTTLYVSLCRKNGDESFLSNITHADDCAWVCNMRQGAFTLLLIVLLDGTAAAENIVAVHVNDDGSYAVNVAGAMWFESGPTAIHVNGAWSSNVKSNATLQLHSHSTHSGFDSWGSYNATQFEWRTRDGVRFVTTVRSYSAAPLLVFEQRFPDGAQNTSTSDVDVMSSYPTLAVQGDSGRLGYLTYSQNMAATISISDWVKAGDDLPGGGSGGLPLIVFDKVMRNAVVLSPANQFMGSAQGVWKSDDGNENVGFGLLGTVREIPKGFSYETVLYAGSGVNSAMKGWGEAMRARYGKTSSYREADFSINYLGYWTDNGGCYWYNAGKTNYEDSLLNVKKAADANNIPFRYLQIDSWWYFKGQGDGVKNWTAMPDVFPHGLPYLHNVTEWPIFAHNRFWAADTTYAKQNGGDYDFIVERGGSLPVSEDFWDFLISSSKRDWGLFVYEQDWLDTEFRNVKALQENVTLGRTWLLQMGEAAQRYGITIQYCMPYPRHLLQTLEIPVVTQTRVSGDYQPGNDQWKIGDTSILSTALGLAPFKDDFWTTDKEEPGCHRYHSATEPYPVLEITIAAYSTGPVGPSDQINMTDRDLVMRTCMTDGFLLKPSRPMRSIDSTFLQRAFGAGGPSGELWTTMTQIGVFQWHHVLAVDLASTYNLMPGDLLDTDDLFVSFDSLSWVVYPHNMSSMPVPFDDSHPLAVPSCGRSDFGLFHMAPVFSNGWVLLGEMNKLVPVSEQRISSVSETKTSLSISMKGVPGEEVIMQLWNVSESRLSPSGKVDKYSCIFPSNGMLTLSVPDGNCM